MLLNLLAKGVLIGFSIAMPVGPIGLLCIQNSLLKGKRHGFMTGLGAAVADAFYGALAGLGMATLTTALIDYKVFFQIFGGFFLCCLGLLTIKANKNSPSKQVQPTGSASVFLTTFFLTLTNPLTIFSFLGIYAGLGIAVENRLDSTLFLTTGVFLGSALWWLLLSSGAALFKHKLSPTISKWLNRLSGAILIIFGILTLFI